MLRGADILYALHWYTYPLPVQKMILLSMQQMQQARYLNGMGFVECSLEFYTKVRTRTWMNDLNVILTQNRTVLEFYRIVADVDEKLLIYLKRKMGKLS